MLSHWFAGDNTCFPFINVLLTIHIHYTLSLMNSMFNNKGKE